MNKNLISHAALFFSNFIYALNYTIAKDVMPNYIKPSGFIFLRVTGAVILFSLIYFLLIKEKVEKQDYVKLFICALFGVAINQLLFFQGLNLSTPINAAIIMTTNPVLVLIISFIIINEPLTVRKVLGIFLGIIGALFLISGTGEISINNQTKIGNIFIFINATSYAIYLVLVKPLMQKYQPITVMFYVFLFGLVLVTPFGYRQLLEVNWLEIPSYIFFEIIFVVIFTTFIAYLLNSVALKNLNPSVVSTYIYLQPIIASVFAIYMQKDSFSILKMTAIIFIFIGVYLVSTRKNFKTKQKLF